MQQQPGRHFLQIPGPTNTPLPILMFETGWFSSLWGKVTKSLGFAAEVSNGDWRTGVDANVIESKLRQDKMHSYKAVAIVHSETSTGVTSDVAAVRRSHGSIDYRHDQWGGRIATEDFDGK